MAAAAPEWTMLPQLNGERAGTAILFATDEWFAEAGNLNREGPPQFDPNAFDTHGKVMDGWESRRKRTAGHDWCLMKLGLSGVIRGFEVDTSFFTGNQVPRISIQAACISGDLPPVGQGATAWTAKPRKGSKATDEEARRLVNLGTDKWHTLVPMTPLQPGYIDCCKHFFPVEDARRWTHLRINYFPDGGVARIRCFGEVQKDWGQVVLGPEELVDLAATENGGIGLMASNSHYGRPQNMLGMGRAVNMGDGWETARNPNRPPVFATDEQGMMKLPGNDWCVIQLGAAGLVRAISIDTLHFKGNYPESCLIEAACSPGSSRLDFKPEEAQWKVLLPRTRLSPHNDHRFDDKSGMLNLPTPVTHIRLTIYPDGVSDCLLPPASLTFPVTGRVEAADLG
ncbi:hypothetical protein GUITHDRAFT_71482 [Guillardia theta CCMP2712]|uniref:Allantoicase domain-containing protein n=1 Tax=Guillardia theta (strain CCMP2712) TaxID=905079 RepID=L1JAQ9_GUITC|nr:hypothetical protein GUITHDRAFT_71482 [Guillardia theta CCMP2712]EKX45184.1 hypothetical protein GUITHDRAFT_71482 [Guillardia theta CCMP2712]|eukprot:XP_005832164.1 hypothetical protein GUITHDRAFT_71482 [Guillardia theta CCMP2712]